ncbi:MAG: type II toxin-antitoxin system RelE/ParE family toxin [Akkermansiaceae bacterium]
MILELSDDAKADLQSISQYTLDTWGVEQEELYLKRLYSKLREVQQTPERWRFRKELHPDCQCAPVGRHVIFFCIGRDTLKVARILHQSMDYESHVSDELFE